MSNVYAFSKEYSSSSTLSVRGDISKFEALLKDESAVIVPISSFAMRFAVPESFPLSSTPLLGQILLL